MGRFPLFVIVAVALCVAAPAQILRIERVAGLAPAENVDELLQDGRAATATTLCAPLGVAAGDGGVVYVADSCRGAVRAVSPGGVISTVAGGGSDGDGGPGRLAGLERPLRAVETGADGSLYLLTGARTVRRLHPNGLLETVWETDALDIAVDAAGALYAVGADGALRRRGPNGRETVLAEGLLGATGIDATADGDIYVAESGTHLVLRVTPDGGIQTVAGQRGDGRNTGDNGPAAAAAFHTPTDVALGPDGSLYVLASKRVRRVDPQGTVTTVAGGGAARAVVYWGDGGRATEALLADPTAIAVSADGDVYVAERGLGRVRRVHGRTGVISTVAGSLRFTGDGPVGEATAVGRPSRVAFDSAGDAYFADTLNHRVRKISADGAVTTVAGTGESGFSGDGSSAVGARLSFPQDVAIDGLDRIYVADTGNHRIRRITGAVIETVAGDGAARYGGDGLPARMTSLSSPKAVAVDGQGRILIADTDNHRVRRVRLDGVIETAAGNGQVGSGGDGGPATQAQLILPDSLAVAADGVVYISDPAAGRVRRMRENGLIDTALADAAELLGVAVGPDGAVWVSADRTVQRLFPDGSVTALDIRDRDTTFRPAGSAAARISLGADGKLWMAGESGVFRETADQPRRPLLALNGVTTGGRAGFLPAAPGAIVQVFGARLGPEAGVAAELDAEGRLPRQLGGVRLLLDDEPLSLLYAGAGQVNAVVPFGLRIGETAQLRAERDGLASNALTLETMAAAPALFTDAEGMVAALNRDGTVNGTANPEARGSIVSLFLTGFGRMAEDLEDGVEAGLPLVEEDLPVRATIGGAEALTLYAGTAPGLLHGVVQVNLEIPFGAQTGEAEVVVWSGDTPTQEGRLAVR